MATATTTAPGVDHLSVLTGATAGAVLEAAVGQAGGRLAAWTLRDVEHRPAGRVTASYSATVRWDEGEPQAEILGATIADDTPEGGLIVSDGERDIQVWRYPFDPELPALASATYPHAVADLLRGIGLDADGLQLNVVTYRPRKRAVVEVTTPQTRLFLKVLRPSVARDVDARHRLLTDAGVPVPRSLGWSDTGLVVLEALQGRPMRSSLAEPADGKVIDPHEVISLLDRLPGDVVDLPRRKPWSAHSVHYADVVAAARPVHAERVRELGSVIASRLAGALNDDGDVPTHGDFYDSQVFVADGEITGLLDIDTMGPGHIADDLACSLAHLSILTTIGPFADGASRALRAWQPAFESRVDPQELRLRAAGVTLSLATGPFRAQEPGWENTTDQRIELVERWIAAAG